MFLRQLFTAAIMLSAIVCMTPVVNATLPPEVRKELSELMKELKDVNSHVKKKEVDQAKAIIKKVEDRITELAIPEDEKDRAYSTFKGQLEKAKNLIPVSFEHEVAPILKDNCLRCHGEENPRANLRMDTFNGIVKGGQNGVPVAPRLPARSALVLRMASPDDQLRMPKGGAKLADADIVTVARWIEQGANYDGTDRDAPIGESTEEKKEPPKPPKPVNVVMADGSETVSFKDEVAPWLVNICMGCHSGNTPRGKFGFTTFEQLLQGGPTGITIYPGKPEESYIVDLVLRQEPLKMPQGQAQLKRSQAVALETWIREGAHFDGKDPKAPLRDIVPTAAQLAAAQLAKMTDEEFAARRITEAAALWKRVSPNTEGATATSTNFYFYGTVSEDRLKQLSEAAETHLAELAKRYPLPAGEQAFRGRLAVFVTKDRFDYEEFNTVLLNRRTPKTVSGHSTINANFETAYIAMHDVGDTESASALTTEQLMNSLLSQSYLTRDGANLPDWLKQGFGMLESGLKSENMYVKAIPGRAAKAVSTITDAGKLFDDGTLAPEEVGEVGYLLVKFLQSQGGPARFQQLVDELRKNPNAARAVEQVYSTPATQLGQLFLQSGGK
ncbi:MAG: c-type cytochrome domain-containing protein [Planctomycetaceae bacterium]